MAAPIGPSAGIIAAAAAERTVVAGDGTCITLRRLNALDKLRLFKAAGPILSQNEPWLGLALLACSVVAIDDVPVPTPTTEAQIEAMVGRLGDAGIAAVAAALAPVAPVPAHEVAANAGN
jgi:hypothetical protein